MLLLASIEFSTSATVNDTQSSGSMHYFLDPSSGIHCHTTDSEDWGMVHSLEKGERPETQQSHNVELRQIAIFFPLLESKQIHFFFISNFFLTFTIFLCHGQLRSTRHSV